MTTASSHLRRFRFSAVNSTGGLVSGARIAPDEPAVVAGLSRDGLFPVRVVPESRWATPRRASALDASLGLNALASLLEAGLPIARALAVLEQLAPTSWSDAIPEIRDRVRGGESLATALGSDQVGITEVALELVRAGESAGDLGSGVRAAAIHAEERHQQWLALLSALTYPGLLALVAIASLVVLTGVVIPRFALVLADVGADMPTSTVLLLQIASTVRRATPPTCAVIVILAVVVAWSRKQEPARAWFDAAILRIPGIGLLVFQQCTARVASASAALLRRGTGISDAMRHSARAAGNVEIMARILRARELVLRGERVSDALETTHAVSDISTRLIRAGEEIGDVPRMLDEVARFEANRAQALVRRFTQLLEPAIIIAFGGLVAFVAAALLQAVYAIRISD